MRTLLLALLCLTLAGKTHAAAFVTSGPFDWTITGPRLDGVDTSPFDRPIFEPVITVSYDGASSLGIATEYLLPASRYVDTLYFNTASPINLTAQTVSGMFDIPTVSYGSFSVVGRTFNTAITFSGMPGNNRRFGWGDSVTFDTSGDLMATSVGDYWSIAHVSGQNSGYYGAAVPEPMHAALAASLLLGGFSFFRWWKRL